METRGTGHGVKGVKKSLEDIQQYLSGSTSRLGKSESIEILSIVQQLYEKLSREYPEIQKMSGQVHGQEKLASLTGDLDIFDLPDLVQHLSELGLSGCLTLRDTNGHIIGSMTLINGRLKNCSSGRLKGEEAFYQLMENPKPGCFHFVKKIVQSAATTAVGLRKILPLILEGARRHDELQKFRTQIPDTMRFRTVSESPSRHSDEKDLLLVLDVWTAVQNGANAIQVESGLPLDSFRVRRLLAHWLMKGDLKPLEDSITECSLQVLEPEEAAVVSA